MGKKIIVLNSSPRINGNTMGLVKAFTEGAESAGNIVNIFVIDNMHIKGCKGCYGGGKDKKSPCTQKDDMDFIYPEFNDADIVVLASPQYFGTINGQLLIVLDRLFATMEGDADPNSQKKECYLLMAAEDYEFDDAASHYYSLIKRFGWNSTGVVFAGGVDNIGDINGHSELNTAKKLGAAIK